MNRAENDYTKAKDWLDSLNQNNIVPGLERIRKLMKALANPEKKLEIVIVGGTNAKGSTCFNLNYNIAQSGLKVGCFTSPHIHTIRERVRINDKLISKQEFTDLIELIRKITEDKKINATYFEIMTAIAYQYFYSKNVDYAIMEIGLGGEWDAVNIGNANIAILTTLGIDHTDYLGTNKEDIGKTKAKIVRDKSYVITGWPKEYHKLIPSCKNLIYSETLEEWIQHTLDILKIKRNIELIKIPGRYEKSNNFVIDTAHNLQAMEFLISIDNDYEKIIIGMMKDKDIKGIIECLPNKCEILVCNLKTERSANNKDLALFCKILGYKFKEFESIKQAMKYANNSKTLVTGSFHTVCEAREYLKLKGHSEL